MAQLYRFGAGNKLMVQALIAQLDIIDLVEEITGTLVQNTQRLKVAQR